ncbi:hypothetical protein BDV28DRAFT_164390 [Aspergillus coremiiformis]|uniref:RNase H type-1 domain-containing protein n=1 Tax=Aspergillus coremiiformis TaxID=138285 RepID=A0A5N6Z9V4_9EURO|nr:hypothetical protein BDV28DRAFT_164390 [Aspergillus coremiiformis]
MHLLSFLNVFFKDYNAIDQPTEIPHQEQGQGQSPTTTLTINTKRKPQDEPLSATELKRRKREKKQAAIRRKLTNQRTFHHVLKGGFYGDLIALPYNDAIENAQQAHNLPRTKIQPHTFWVDASGCNKSSGAAVAYQMGDEWHDRGYAISDLQDVKRVELTELFAIGAGLRLALIRIGKRVVVDGEEHAVTVFSDSMNAMGMLWRYSAGRMKGEKMVQSVAEDVCGLSRELWQLGVKVRVYWVPAHCSSHITGHKRADVLSKAAARHVKLFQKFGGRSSTDGVIELVDSNFLQPVPLLLFPE